MNRYKKSYTVKVGTVMLSTLLLLGSCSEDAIIDDNGGKLGAASDNICFGISDNDGWPETRSAHTAADEVVTGNFVLRSADNADTLCVQTTVCDFGPLPFGNNAPTSRAALVSEPNMHGSFGVTACLTDDNSYLFFNEENQKPDNYNPSAIWSYTSGNIYYWPGETHPLKFYAYSPYGCEGLTPPVKPDNGNAAPSFSYTVPADAANQTDLLAYATEEMSGATNTSVPLSFRHICTAVQFVVGKEMQPGSIKTIRLKGVRNSGTYSFDTDWALGETTAEFVHNVNKDVSVSTPDDTEKENITDDTDCFIMLPQTLPDGASVEIVFHDNTTGTDRTLTASIAGQEWPQGKRVKYNISISPDYKFEFSELTDIDGSPKLDAHYDKCKIKIKASKTNGNSWTLQSSLDNVTFLTETNFETDPQYELLRNGYWIDKIIDTDHNNTEISGRGTNEITFNGDGEQTVYVYVEEYLGEENRAIPLEIVMNDKVVTSTDDLMQYAPYKSDAKNLYSEHIDSSDADVWGFLWTREVNLKRGTGIWEAIIGTIIFRSLNNLGYVEGKGAILGAGGRVDATANAPFITKVTGYALFGIYNIGEITLDYSKIALTDIADSRDDGHANSKKLFDFNGVSTLSQIESLCRQYGWSETVINGNGELPDIFAARTAAKCNAWIAEKRTETQGTETVTYYTPVLPDENFKWYLPAINQCNSEVFCDAIGTYWTSTAGNSPNSIIYMATLDAEGEDRRDVEYKVRACRNRP